MFARLFAVAFLVALAVATDGQCDTGSIQCCQSSITVGEAESLGLIPTGSNDVDLVGIKCSPVTVIGTSTGCEANQEPLCCSDCRLNGVCTDCTPINVSA
ncbi:hypothetical protein DFH29DRAFT_1004893 [Suillus ampliporus]|nr:hypothetical protein DFH29DRAFT_1004893 [Suillus ampliporus]